MNDLLDVSRIQAGKLELRLMPCDLTILVRDEIEEQRLAHPDRTIVMDLADAGVDRVKALADPDRIRQVVTNYLTNAIKYSGPATPITVSIDRDHASAGGDEVRVTVRDEGHGIPGAELERVWERFHRVRGAAHAAGAGSGLGLGLAISRELIERHRGHVGVESVEGHGSAFWFTLPLAR